MDGFWRFTALTRKYVFFKMKKDYKKASRKRIENGGDVKSELQYIDMIKKIERAGDCVFSILL